MTDLAPCGTAAAYRRHQRNGETPDYECQQAAARDQADKGRNPSGRNLLADPRPRRNGLPEWRPYVYRGAGYDTFEAAP